MSDVTSGGLSNSPDGRSQYDYYGGLTILGFGAILLACSFMTQSPVPLTLQGSIVVFGAVGIAVAFGFLPVRNQQDFYGGMSLILLSLTAFVASNELPGMRGFAFGPATAPRLFALALLILSFGVVLSGLLSSGPKVTPYNLRGIIFIVGAILAFAAAIRPLGLVVAAFSTIVICSAASPEVKWRETVIWASILTLFCTLLFPYGLNLPFQLWPRWFM